MKATCKNCKFLCHSKAKVSQPVIDVELIEYRSDPNRVIDAISEYYCQWMWFTVKPVGNVCEHWKFKNGKNWL